jgi:hypothetical protein
MHAMRLFTTVGDDLLHALPELGALRGHRVEVVVLEETEPVRGAATPSWGFLEGKMRLKETFDDPLPEDVMLAFEGRGT